MIGARVELVLDHYGTDHAYDVDAVLDELRRQIAGLGPIIARQTTQPVGVTVWHVGDVRVSEAVV